MAFKADLFVFACGVTGGLRDDDACPSKTILTLFSEFESDFFELVKSLCFFFLSL